jgi:hypothetical protein
MPFQIPNRFTLKSPASHERMNENFVYVENFYNGGLRGDSLQDDTITAAYVTDNSITNAKYQDDAITNAKMTADSVDSDQMDLDSISAVDLLPADGFAGNPKLLYVPEANDNYYPSIIVGHYTQTAGGNDVTTPAAGTEYKTYSPYWSEIFDDTVAFQTNPYLVFGQIIPDDITLDGWKERITFHIRYTSTERVVLRFQNLGTTYGGLVCTVRIIVINHEEPLNGE